MSRVQLSIQIPKNFYFTYRTTRYKHVLFSINGATNQFSKTKDTQLDFENESSVQVKQDLYAFKNLDEPRLVHYSNLNDTNKICWAQKARPLQDRYGPSLVNFNHKFLFISGGCTEMN